MKLLFFSEVYTPWQGGAIVAIRNLMRQLTENGNEVIMVTGEKRSRWRLKGSRIERDDECHAKVYRIAAIPYPFNKMATMTVPDYGTIKQIILTEKPDCIHIFSPIGIAGKIALGYAKRLHIPIVVTNHIMPENFTYNVKLHSSLKNIAEKIIYKDLIDFCNQAKIVTAPTKTAINLLLKHGLQTDYEIVTNGVDAQYFHPGKTSEKSVERFNLKKADKYILYVGRLDGEKRVDLLITAMPFVLKYVPHAKLLIAGKGLQNTNLQQLTDNLQVNNSVTFLGMVTEEEKLALLQTTDIFAIASPSELQCIAALEALSCGLPIVVADQMALTELTDGNNNGLQFNYPDEKNLADKLCRLLNDTKLREEMSKNGREWIVQNHQLSRVFELFEPIYKKAIKR
jgi:glycosyltransferase involved in cell wall biosynthesis